MYTITELYSYPIKGCRGVARQSVDISPDGIAGDRQLVVLRKGKIATQLKFPRLARVLPERLGDNLLRISSQDMPDVECPISSEGDRETIDIFGNAVSVIRQAEPVNQWLSEVVGKEVYLATMAESFVRDIPLPEFAIHNGKIQSRFVDLAPILLTNEASLAELNHRLPTPLPMNRFRPNIVISGAPAHTEDEVEEYRSNEITLRRSGSCERCGITCTDQLTGERGLQPLRTLREYRKRANAYGSGIVFGAYLAVEGEGELRVGDVLA